MIKAIIFDLGGVYFTDGTTIALKKIEKEFKLPFGVLREIFSEKGELGRKYRKGEIDEERFWDEAEKRLKLEGESLLRIREIWHSSYKPNPGMKDLVISLRRKYRVAVLSNNTSERVKYLNERYGLDSVFDVYVYSFDYGRLKPDPFLFMEVLEKLGVRAEESVLIDNRVKILREAERLGINTILFKSEKQLKEELRALGLEF